MKPVKLLTIIELIILELYLTNNYACHYGNRVKKLSLCNTPTVVQKTIKDFPSTTITAPFSLKTLKT